MWGVCFSPYFPPGFNRGALPNYKQFIVNMGVLDLLADQSGVYVIRRSFFKSGAIESAIGGGLGALSRSPN